MIIKLEDLHSHKMQVKKRKKNALDIIEMNIFVIVCLCVYVYTRMFDRDE